MGYASLQPDDPREIGPYRLLGQLGSGGMGQVFLGMSAGGRPIAVKVIRTELATVPADNESERALTTAAPLTKSPSGMSGGTGSATASVLTADAGSRTSAALPAVVKPVETQVPGVSPAAPGTASRAAAPTRATNAATRPTVETRDDE